jgi:lipid A ethanolaminephosphotransferase
MFLVLHNATFWSETVATLWKGSLRDTLFLGSLFLLMVFVHATFLLLIPGKTVFRVAVTALFLVAALAAYSADTYGVAIDKDMVRNLFETDRREVGALLNFRFLLYCGLLGLLPSLLVWRMEARPIGVSRHVFERLGFLLVGAGLSVAMMFALFSDYSSFLHEHKNLRHLLNPGAAIDGALRYARSNIADKDMGVLADEDGTDVRLPRQAGTKPLLVFLVVGETARAKNFQLGGYERATNPELSRLDNVYYFRNVTSCGTSTAISLPCMFSHLGKDTFTVARANHTTGLLDGLMKAGIHTEWRDNNSGGKGTNARIPTISYSPNHAPALCNEESCYDEIMLSGLDSATRAINDDAIVVFHQIGSHGPAYSKRYPAGFERFAPVCRTIELKQCSAEQIRNAYDNTIVYTDHNLARQIGILESVSDRFDTALIYVSDHGESLGEKGLYLHGAPYVFAPAEQTNVPMIVWMSDAYRKRFSIESGCMSAQLGKPFSHDNVYHTVLGAMGVRNALYQDSMDVIKPCRQNDPAASH